MMDRGLSSAAVVLLVTVALVAASAGAGEVTATASRAVPNGTPDQPQRLFLPLIMRDFDATTAQPDLIVTHAYINMRGYDGGCILQYTTMVVVACVRNQGPGIAGPFSVNVDDAFGANALGIVPGGQACLDTVPAQYGFSPVTIVVDPANQVAESIEINNTWTGILPLPTPPLPCSPTPTPAPDRTPEPPDGTASPRW